MHFYACIYLDSEGVEHGIVGSTTNVDMEDFECKVFKCRNYLESLTWNPLRHRFQENMWTRELDLHVSNVGLGICNELIDNDIIIIDGGGS